MMCILSRAPETKITPHGNDFGIIGSLHLAHIEGWVHVVGGHTGDNVEVEIPELNSKGSGVLDADGRAKIPLGCIESATLVAGDAEALQSQNKC